MTRVSDARGGEWTDAAWAPRLRPDARNSAGNDRRRRNSQTMVFENGANSIRNNSCLLRYLKDPVTDLTASRAANAVITIAKPEVSRLTPASKPSVQAALSGQL